MTLNEIAAWLDERITIPARHEYRDTPTGNLHRVIFENGDTYEQQARDVTLWSMSASYKINGQTVRETRFTYQNFGWKEAQTA